MRIIFLVVIIASSLELFGVEKAAYFEMVHKKIPQITAKVSDGLKLLDNSFSKVEELSISSDGEDNGFEVSMRDDINSGTVSIYPSGNDDQNPLLTFEIQKNSRYCPATVKFLSVENNTKAVLYRPSMGGGDRFVLAIGKEDEDVSSEKMQQSLPFGSIQFFIPVCTSNNFGQ